MAAGSTSPPTPRIVRITDHLAFMRSESDRITLYPVEPERCSCPDYRYRCGQSAEYRCKHMEAAFPIRCTQCGTNQVPAHGELCAWCAQDLNEQAKARAYVCDEHDGAVGWEARR